MRTLVGIMKESRAPAGARVSAAIAVLDRGWGKPSQAVEMEVRQDPLKKLSDEELDETIIAVQDIIKRSKGDG